MRLLLKVGFCLVGIFFVIQIGMYAVIRRNASDPLALYQAIMPGKPADAMQSFCQLHAGTIQGVEKGFCKFTAQDGIFGQVIVNESAHRITTVAFDVQPQRLLLGDLIGCWGQPTLFWFDDLGASSRSPGLEWDHRVYIMLADPRLTGGSDYFQFVDTLLLDNPPLLCLTAG